nr:MAG TPA: hypothetical protein [Caudoviricetes sp.]
MLCGNMKILSFSKPIFLSIKSTNTIGETPAINKP